MFLLVVFIWAMPLLLIDYSTNMKYKCCCEICDLTKTKNKTVYKFSMTWLHKCRLYNVRKYRKLLFSKVEKKVFIVTSSHEKLLENIVTASITFDRGITHSFSDIPQVAAHSFLLVWYVIPWPIFYAGLVTIDLQRGRAVTGSLAKALLWLSWLGCIESRSRLVVYSLGLASSAVVCLFWCVTRAALLVLWLCMCACSNLFI